MKRRRPGLRLEAGHPAPVAGVDEAGRGPFAGPVCAAAVILTGNARLQGVDDSKRLSSEQRAAAEGLIKRRALAWSVAFASVEEIAAVNILAATGLAMRRAVEGLALAPAFVLIDGDYLFDLPCKAATVVGGDGLSLSIAAASILAKTARDRLMVAMDEAYPGYGFAAHKGYGVPAHIAALKALGPCPIHRTCWQAVRVAAQGGLELDPPDQA
ncbi:MAG TPA: ribonuclease HII [Caulobacteraceae bacterium]|nr:ribonuclease HII [Caulobacteraceae bacterium]